MTSFADLTTIGVGGPIATFLEPTTRVGVIEAVEEADSQGQAHGFLIYLRERKVQTHVP